MANVYMRLIVTGMRSMSDIRESLRDDVRAEAKKRIGTVVAGVELTKELYAEKFS